MHLFAKSRANLKRTFLTAAVLAAWVLCAGSEAQAHHIRGIPHYTYSENYPSAPMFEDVHELDHFVLRMTYYEIPGTKALDLALYVKNNRTGSPFQGDVTYAVYGENEDPLKAHSVVAYRNKNNIYKAGWVYEHSGLYWVRVTFESEGKVYDDVFKLQMGDPPVNYWYLGLSAGGVVVLIIIVAILKRISVRKEAAEQPALVAEENE